MNSKIFFFSLTWILLAFLLTAPVSTAFAEPQIFRTSVSDQGYVSESQRIRAAQEYEDQHSPAWWQAKTPAKRLLAGLGALLGTIWGTSTDPFIWIAVAITLRKSRSLKSCLVLVLLGTAAITTIYMLLLPILNAYDEDFTITFLRVLATLSFWSLSGYSVIRLFKKIISNSAPETNKKAQTP